MIVNEREIFICMKRKSMKELLIIIFYRMVMWTQTKLYCLLTSHSDWHHLLHQHHYPPPPHRDPHNRRHHTQHHIIIIELMMMIFFNQVFTSPTIYSLCSAINRAVVLIRCDRHNLLVPGWWLERWVNPRSST